ncbi:MAG TPA: D-aminoacylase [Firmicutes bacterium]|nr:D-aminoacylase [Bacillota bacterium]
MDAEEPLDVVIRGGQLVDGTGNPWIRADVGVRGSRVAAIGHLEEERARRVLDATGLVVAPGFVDIHSHSDLALLVDGRAMSKVLQGVTTEVVGNCGLSAAPLRGEAGGFVRDTARHLADHVPWGWRTVGEYLGVVEERGVAVNVATLVGHRTLRVGVMGYSARPSLPADWEEMGRLLAQGLEEGAWGFSTGLAYAPGSYASQEELVYLCQVTARYRAFYSSHIRDEEAHVVEAIQEALEVSRLSGEPVEISHHKGVGRHHRGRAEDTLQLIGEYRLRGRIEVSFDIYPYTAASTWLSSYLPTWALEGGIPALLERLGREEYRARIREQMRRDLYEGNDPPQVWEEFMISRVHGEKPHPWEGKTLAEIAAARGQDPYETVFDVLLEGRGLVSVIRFETTEGELATLLRHPLSVIGSDGSALACEGPLAAGHPHPRNFGTFPRVLARYVREQEVLTLEEAVRKMTSAPASRVGIRDRGLLLPGMAADVVVFDPLRIQDTATYRHPKRYPEGIAWVLVNGQVVAEDGHHTGALPGRILRRASRRTVV